MNQKSSVDLILLAGGVGKRMETPGEQPKQFARLGAQPLFLKTLEPFLSLPQLKNLVIAFPQKWIDQAKELADQFAISDLETAISRPEVKQQLLENTQEAIERQVFGVPTWHTDGHNFWGLDAFDMFLDYLQQPKMFQQHEMRQLLDLPSGASRKG